jgi:hypothetical protein
MERKERISQEKTRKEISNLFFTYLQKHDKAQRGVKTKTFFSSL